MKNSFTNFHGPVAVILTLITFGPGLGIAQTLTTLHSFATASGGRNADGVNPAGRLILAGNTLYGATVLGGPAGNGTVFSVNTDSTGFKVLHSFSALSGSFPGDNSDGANPTAGLVLSGGTLYGTSYGGGAGGVGTVYKVNIDGSGFVALRSFSYPLIPTADGCFPEALLLAGDTFYGTTDGGGFSDNGTVFQMNGDGSGFVSVLGFDLAPPGQHWHWAYPSLIASGETLYGMSGGGGCDVTNGTVFTVAMDGSGFAILHAFTGGEDGTGPGGDLILSGSTLYGVTVSGAGTGKGALFSINTDGSDFTVLHSFARASDGGSPQGLYLSGTTLYGTTGVGGASDRGTVYAVNMDGTGFKTLYSFTGGADGAFPRGGLVVSGGMLYGTTGAGGASTNGTVFSLSLLPQLRLASSGANLVLTWPAAASGVTLQSTAELGPATEWQNFDPETPPIVVDGQCTLTISNAFTGSQRFFRLSQ